MVTATVAAPAGAAKPRFAAGPPADFLTKRLFDIGVADPDRDGRLDIFTANHKFKSVFLRNHRGRSFRNVINQIGLFGFLAMMLFLGILVVGFIYEWMKGALEWE